MIQFGKQPPVNMQKKRAARKQSSLRKDTVAPGLEANRHTVYDHEVEFTNIKPRVNVCRVKDDDSDPVGIAKGAILDGVPLTVPSNSAGATMHAMKKRCDYKPSLENIDSFKRGHHLLMDKFEPLDEIRVDHALFSEYLRKCGAGKAERLANAIGDHELRTDMESKHVFAKQEVLLKPHGAQPRVVYQGTDMYNALTGPVIMALNDRMKSVFSMRNPKNRGNVAIYACGASGEELGDVMEMAAGKPIESDMKNNDGSQSAEFRKYEAMFYRKLGAPVWFVREFAKCTEVRVWTRYGVTAHVRGERWSGETTTTTGNSYVSMALMQASLQDAAIERSVNIHGGDDYLGFVEGEPEAFEAGVAAVTKASGMQAEVVPQRSRHLATFYRKRYVRSSIGCRPVPQFGRVLAKLNLRANRNSEVNDRDYMAGKYLSAAYEHRHVPVIRDMLVATADNLSATPHFDVRATKLHEMGGVDNIKTVVNQASVHPAPEFSEYLNEVYGIQLHDLTDLYARVAESCLQFCEGWTFVDKRGKVKNREGNRKYDPPMIVGEVVDALVRFDV